MKSHKIKLTTVYTLIVCALLLAVNVALGFVLTTQSGRAMKTLIKRHMLSVADTAAASLDGDALGSLTADDVGGEKYNLIYAGLRNIRVAQVDSDIKYIYTVKKDGDRFVFTVDPDPVNPGEFGEEVVPTPSQEIAWAGTSCVDSETYQDEWGSFYTAWSPVKNSAGEVVGLVAVDFVADWYDRQEFIHSLSVAVISGLSVAIGAVMMLILTRQLRRRINLLNSEILILSQNVEELTEEISVRPGTAVPTSAEEESSDSIGALSGKLRVMREKLRSYIEYAHEQAYTDSMTGVGNKTAYLELVKELNEKIDHATASFAVAVFDVNSLKKVNDNFGHECGDLIITDTVKIIRSVFEGWQIFRIGGDEFIAVAEGVDEETLAALLKESADRLAEFNESGKNYTMKLSFSGGGTVFRPGVDADYKEVFRRADEEMYRNKGEYYRQFGDRRRRRDDGNGDRREGDAPRG